MQTACLLILTDPQCIRHTVEVTAESLFEARGTLSRGAPEAAVGRGELCARDAIEIEVGEAAVRHGVTLAQLQHWAAGAARNPAERIRRERLRGLLARDFEQGL